MTQPNRDKPTHPFDPVFGCGMAVVLFVMFGALEFFIVRQLAAPPVPVADTAAAFRDGAQAMCGMMADRAGVPPAEYAPVCSELAAELAAGVTDDR